MSHDTDETRNPPPQADAPAAPLSEQLGFGVGTFLAAGTLDLVAHFGLTGLVVGGIAAYVASQHGPDVLEQVRGTLPTRPAPASARTRKPTSHTLAAQRREGSQRSFLDRALGRFPDTSEEAVSPSDEDTILIEEPEAFPPASSRSFRPALLPQVVRHPIVLSPDLVLEANDIVGAGINIFGVKGSGKTASAVARLAEQFARYHVSQVLFDIKGDLLPLVTDRRQDGRPFVPNGYIGKRGHVPRGRSVLRCGLQAVYDLRTFQTPEQMAQLICFIVEDLLETVALTPEGDLAPCLVFLDEAEYWLPQEQPSYLSGHTYKRLLDAFHLLATMGRSRGLAPVIATQRIAKVNKDIIAQAEMNVLMKAVLDIDLRRYHEYFNKALVSDERIRGFAAGEAVVCLPDGRQVLTRLSQRESRHLSHTPQVTASLARFASPGRRSAPLPIELDDRDAGAAVVEAPGADLFSRHVTLPPPPIAPAEPLADDTDRLFMPPLEPAQVRLSPELAAARAAYLAGATSARGLAEALKAQGLQCEKDKAAALLRQLRDLGAIE